MFGQSPGIARAQAGEREDNSMARATLLLSLLALISLPLASSGCSKNADKDGASAIVQDRVTVERLEKIEKALATEDWALVRRALLESADLVQSQPRLAEIILMDSFLTTWDNFGGLEVRVIRNISGASAQIAVQSFVARKQGIEDPVFYTLLYALAQMRDQSCVVAPALRKRLVQSDIGVPEKMAITACLAVMGQAKSNEIEEIAEAIRSPRYEHPDESPRLAAIITFFWTGLNANVDKRILDALVDALQRSNDEDTHGMALLALSTLGPKAGENVKRAVAGAYANACELSSRNHQQDPIWWYALPLAAVDPSSRHAALRTAFAEYTGDWNERDLFCIPDVYCSAVCDAAFVKEVVSLVSDTDPHVAKSAAYFTWLIGPSAQAATPLLLRLIDAASERDDKDQGALHLAAAQALGMVAMPSDVPSIRELSLKPGLPPDLKRALEESIRIIELGG